MLLKKAAEAPKDPSKEAPKVEGEIDPELDGIEAPPGDDKENSVAKNFERLRAKAKETKKKLLELEPEVATLREKVSKFEKGELIPDVLREKEQEIQRLSQYEKVVNLKSSKEYQEKYVKPLSESQAKLKEMFVDYGIPEESAKELVGKALSFDKQSELNSFLSEHFDALGAIEVKQLVNSAKAIQQEARKLEESPEETISNLVRESEAIRAAKDHERKVKVASTAKGAWAKELMQIRSEKKIPELIRHETDENFNKNIVDPILTQASTEYSRLITEIANAGLNCPSR